ncbi:uncharacterized protein LOC110617976 isoform X2 [Manihot esculenta]|uniref:Uncharacterized protein n=1 Tax=Manihot esculenta TaxID=3983 RepID=A0ACB7IGF1_MANES|nr:uncharacterized protein LOC110617976 isoform X2 [Manihot esculenta]KAG8663269.1 hypothetical protein MANES_01G193800v8 [Manihot esculenta]
MGLVQLNFVEFLRGLIKNRKEKQRNAGKMREMKKWNSRAILPFLICLLALLLLLSAPSVHAFDHTANGVVGRRILLGFKEKPGGSNLTFDCSPSGACVPCIYSEKSNEKYRCSETGYRIPLKCVEIKDSTKNGNENKSQNSRSSIELSNENANAQESSHGTVSNKPRGLLDDSSTLEDGSQVYITYRSCITPVNEEKLSVVGFEVCFGK